MNYRKLSAFLLTIIIYTILVFTAYKIIDNMHLSNVYNEKKIKVNLRNKTLKKPKTKPTKKIDKKILKKKIEKAKFPKQDKKSPVSKLPVSKLPKPPKKQVSKKEIKPTPTLKKESEKTAPSKFLEKKRAPTVAKSSPKKSTPKKEITKKIVSQKKPISISELKKFFKKEHNITIKQKKKSPLYNSILALPVKKEQKKKKLTPKNLIGQPIEKLYGDDFNKMSPYQRDYILNNAGMMQQITQKVLNRIGRINIPAQMHFNSVNVVEFKLYPSGDISDITMLESAGFKILDETTRETIEYAYKDYPHPDEPITIRFLVGYYLMGF